MIPPFAGLSLTWLKQNRSGPDGSQGLRLGLPSRWQGPETMGQVLQPSQPRQQEAQSSADENTKGVLKNYGKSTKFREGCSSHFYSIKSQNKSISTALECWANEEYTSQGVKAQTGEFHTSQ